MPSLIVYGPATSLLKTDWVSAQVGSAHIRPITSAIARLALNRDTHFSMAVIRLLFNIKIFEIIILKAIDVPNLGPS